MTTATIEIEVDVPDGVTILGYERHQEAHVFEVSFDLPARCTCPKYGHEERGLICAVAAAPGAASVRVCQITSR
jgi:hypothetical protein